MIARDSQGGQTDPAWRISLRHVARPSPGLDRATRLIGDVKAWRGRFARFSPEGRADETQSVPASQQNAGHASCRQ